MMKPKMWKLKSEIIKIDYKLLIREIPNWEKYSLISNKDLT